MKVDALYELFIVPVQKWMCVCACAMSGTSARSLHRHVSMRHPRKYKCFTTASVVASRTPLSLIKMPVTFRSPVFFAYFFVSHGPPCTCHHQNAINVYFMLVLVDLVTITFQTSFERTQLSRLALFLWF